MSKNDFEKYIELMEDNPLPDKDWHKTIQYALRLADRLQSGEVSDEIITRMVHEWTLYAKASAPTNIMWKAVADAMTAQLMKEVENE